VRLQIGELVDPLMPDEDVAGREVVEPLLQPHGHAEQAVDRMGIRRHCDHDASRTQPCSDRAGERHGIIHVFQHVECQHRVVELVGFEGLEHRLDHHHGVMGMALAGVGNEAAASLHDVHLASGSDQLARDEARAVAEFEKPGAVQGGPQDRGDRVALCQLLDVGVVDLAVQVVLLGESIEIVGAEHVGHGVLSARAAAS